MKGIILAGGTGTRLYPITKVLNKHLLPVGRYPMIYHAIHKMKSSGILDVMVITSKEDVGNIVSFLGSGKEFGVAITYRVQEDAGGIAEALGLCRNFIGNDRLLVILGDNIFEDDISPYVDQYKQQEEGAKILVKEVNDPSRFGVAYIENSRIIKIEEKPREPKSHYAVTGIYMYDQNVFNIIDGLSRSDRGELEITDINNWYIQQQCLSYNILQGWWTDAGTHASLHLANILAQKISLE